MPAKEKGDLAISFTTVLVSRVLCPFAWAATIYLCRALPHGSERLLLPPSGHRRGAVAHRGVPPKGVASDRVYMASHVTAGSVSSYLAFPSLPLARRFISVALSLRSPSADVIRYPSPMKPGLSSRYYLSAPYRAAAPHTCSLIIHASPPFVKRPYAGFRGKREVIFAKGVVFSENCAIICKLKFLLIRGYEVETHRPSQRCHYRSR